MLLTAPDPGQKPVNILRFVCGWRATRRWTSSCFCVEASTSLGPKEGEGEGAFTSAAPKAGEGGGAFGGEGRATFASAARARSCQGGRFRVQGLLFIVYRLSIIKS